MPDLKNKVAIITGAASGIGQATAGHFASLGCFVSMVDLRNLEKTRLQCVENGLSDDKIVINTGNITNPDFQEEIVAATLKHFGQLDILVNCAGIISLQTLSTVKMEDLDFTIDINFKSYFRLIQLSIPFLKESKGSVVNVSSRVTQSASIGLLPYDISKAAVDQLTRFAAKELAPFQIRVNSVNPGSVRTGIAKNMPGLGLGVIFRLLRVFVKESGCLMGRIAKPVEIARTIAFLASEDASFITGIHLVVDGGRSLV